MNDAGNEDEEANSQEKEWNCLDDDDVELPTYIEIKWINRNY